MVPRATTPVLATPDFAYPFEYYTTHQFAIGSTLLQDQGDGLQPIAYESRKLRIAERDCSILELELLAVVKTSVTLLVRPPTFNRFWAQTTPATSCRSHLSLTSQLPKAYARHSKARLHIPDFGKTNVDIERPNTDNYAV